MSATTRSSRIPVLKQQCLNAPKIHKRDAPQGKQSSRFLTAEDKKLLKKVERLEREKEQEKAEFASLEKENEELKNQITEYEKLCFNVGETKRAFTPPPPLSPPPLVTSTRPATSQQEEEKEEKVSAFVDAVIQRSQQALLDDEELDPQPSCGSGAGQSYKELYHSSVLRCEGLQLQVDRLVALLNKLQSVEEMKQKALDLLSENKDSLDEYHKSLLSRSQEWEKKMQVLATENETLSKERQCLSQQLEARETEVAELMRSHAQLLARHSVKTAQLTLESRKLQKNLQSSKSVLSQLSMSVKSYKHSEREAKESLEFCEAERTTLAEVNTELESNVCSLKQSLEDQEKRIADLNEKLRISEQQRTQIEEWRRASGLSGLEGLCDEVDCRRMREELGAALTALNRKSCVGFGDLLHKNFVLQQQVRELNTNVSQKALELEKLTLFTQDYQMKSKEKIDVLKANLAKADCEIRELDEYVEHIRQVLHSCISTVRKCPPLLHLLKEIDETVQ